MKYFDKIKNYNTLSYAIEAFLKSVLIKNNLKNIGIDIETNGYSKDDKNVPEVFSSMINDICIIVVKEAIMNKYPDRDLNWKLSKICDKHINDCIIDVLYNNTDNLSLSNIETKMNDILDNLFFEVDELTGELPWK